MSEKRGHLYLLTGLIIGVLVGVLLSMMLPVQYTDTDPSLLQNADKDLYRSLIASAYLVEVDNNRAQARLELLGDVNPPDALVAQAQQLLASGGSEEESRALALLAAAINEGVVQITALPNINDLPVSPPLETNTVNTPVVEPTGNSTKEPAADVTRTPVVTVTPRPTVTPLPTEGSPYELVEQSEVCDAGLSTPLIQVYVFDLEDNPVAGVRIEISITDRGMEVFYTGLYPEISPGYADYQMVEGMIYNLRVGTAGQLVQNLSIPRCETDDGKSFPGSIKLIFKNPD